MEPLRAVRDADAATEAEGAASDGASAQSLPADPDLVLSFTDDQQITLHAVTSQGNRELGTFDDVLDAWAAVDRIDLEEVEKLLAAERAPAGIPDDLRAA